MNPNVIQLHNVSPEEFKNDILTGVQEKLNQFQKNLETKKSPVYLTRKEVSSLLGVSLVTIHEWCKKGILKPIHIGSRVRFRKSDIEKTLEG